MIVVSHVLRHLARVIVIALYLGVCLIVFPQWADPSVAFSLFSGGFLCG